MQTYYFTVLLPFIWCRATLSGERGWKYNDDPINLVDPSGKNSPLTDALLCVGGGVIALFGLAILTFITGGLAAIADVTLGTTIGTLIAGCVATVLADYLTQFAHSAD